MIGRSRILARRNRHLIRLIEIVAADSALEQLWPRLHVRRLRVLEALPIRLHHSLAVEAALGRQGGSQREGYACCIVTRWTEHEQPCLKAPGPRCCGDARHAHFDGDRVERAMLGQASRKVQ